MNTKSLTDINNIEILRVYINGISVMYVYKPPGERVSFHQPLTAVGFRFRFRCIYLETNSR